MLLGVIGDDFTGSGDIANTLAKAGMRAVLYPGVPQRDAGADVEAGIVALKTRSIPPAEAVARSLEALDWLQAQGCRQFVFKVCSTFDSTPAGNIGPVADALLERLGAPLAIVCPAFPATGRTLYQGHLFVGDRLLSESGMERHPITPMTDSDIRRWLALQARSPVGHVPWRIVAQGPAAVRDALDREAAAGRRLVVVDALDEADLLAIGRAAAGLTLVTGGSGIAMGLPANFREAGLLGADASPWRGVNGPAACLAGSCSQATREQVARHAAAHPTLDVTADAVMHGRVTAESVAIFLLEHADAVPLAYSSAEPGLVARAQEIFGGEQVARAIEHLFARAAQLALDQGVKRLVVAGGETSGAVVTALSLDALEIGPEIDPGVPAMCAVGRDVALALKSGNFGAPDFFEKAVGMLGEPA